MADTIVATSGNSFRVSSGRSSKIQGAPAPVTVFHDTFSGGTNVAISGKQADTVNVGSNVYVTDLTSGTARWQYSGTGYGKLSTTSGIHRLYYDIEQTVYTYTCTWRLDRLSVHDFRYTSHTQSTRVVIYASNDSNQVLIQQNTGSGYVNLVSPLTSTGFADLANYYLTVPMTETGFTIIINDGTTDRVNETIVNSVNASATRIGFWNGASSGSSGSRILEHKVVA